MDHLCTFALAMWNLVEGVGAAQALIWSVALAYKELHEIHNTKFIQWETLY